MPTDCDVKQKSEPIWVLLTQSARRILAKIQIRRYEKRNANYDLKKHESSHFLKSEFHSRYS